MLHQRLKPVLRFEPHDLLLPADINPTMGEEEQAIHRQLTGMPSFPQLLRHHEYFAFLTAFVRDGAMVACLVTRLCRT